MAEFEPAPRSSSLTPDEAVTALAALHGAAVQALRAALDRFVTTGQPPGPEERRNFCYPLLRVTWTGAPPRSQTARAFAKFQAPGVYATTVTQPEAFRP